MGNLADSMKAARAGSLARRPAIANSGPTSTPTMGGEYEGKTRLGDGAILAINRIIPDPDQPRKTFPDESLDRLASSMKARGQLVPILIRWNPTADRYVVIDGERRYRAAVRAGLPTMACVIDSDLDPDTILELQLVANALREDVAPVEQAKAWERLMKSQGLTQQQLADKLGYERSSISKAFDLLNLTPEIQALVDSKQIPASTASEIGKRHDPDDQQVVVDQVMAQGLSRAKAVEVADRVARKKSSKGAGSKSKLDTTWKFKSEGGWRLSVERAKGLEPSTLLDFLRAAVASVEAKVGAAPEPPPQ